MEWPAHTCCCSSCEFTLHKAALRKFTRAEKRGSPLESPLEPVKKKPHEGAWTTVPSGPNKMAAMQGQKLGANPQRNSSAHRSADTIALAAEWGSREGGPGSQQTWAPGRGSARYKLCGLRQVTSPLRDCFLTCKSEVVNSIFLIRLFGGVNVIMYIESITIPGR